MFDMPVPDGWRLVKLSDLGEVNRGRSRHRPRDAAHLYGGEYPFVQTGDVKASGGRITKNTQTYSEDGLAQSRLWPKNTMCITIAANIAETGILQFPACFPDSVIGFVPDETKCNVYFIEYIFRLLRKHIQAQATGSVQDNINLQTLERLLFPIPELEEQNRLAKVLCSFDNKIELNRQTNQTLEHIAQALFKCWFVDFEPIRAKIIATEKGANTAIQELAAQAIICGAITLEQLEAITQNLETTLQQAINEKLNQANQTPINTEQLKTTAALFPNALVDSELGEIPEGWGCKALSEWGAIICGKTPSKKKDEYYGGDIPFIKIPDMHGNMYVIESVDTLTEEGAETQRKKILPEGSICVSCIATVGQVVITCEESFTNQQINSIIPIERFYTPYLYFSMLEQNKNIHDLASGGSATLNLNTGNFSKIEIVRPHSELLKKFSVLVESMLKDIITNQLQQKELTSIRDTLLPKLLSGELEIDKVS